MKYILILLFFTPKVIIAQKTPSEAIQSLNEILVSIEKKYALSSAEAKEFKFKLKKNDKAFKIIKKKYVVAKRDKDLFASLLIRANATIENLTTKNTLLIKKVDILDSDYKIEVNKNITLKKNKDSIEARNTQLRDSLSSTNISLDNQNKQNSNIVSIIPVTAQNKFADTYLEANTEKIFEGKDLKSIRIQAKLIERIKSGEPIINEMNVVLILYIRDTAFDYIPCKLIMTFSDNLTATYEIEKTLPLNKILPPRCILKGAMVKNQQFNNTNIFLYKNFYTAYADSAFTICSLKNADREIIKKLATSPIKENFIVTGGDVKLILSDKDDPDNDSVRVYLNDKIFIESLKLKTIPDIWDLKLMPGENKISIEALNQGDRDVCTIGIEFMYRKKGFISSSNRILNKIRNFDSLTGQIYSYHILVR
jgi:hypothetical protein